MDKIALFLQKIGIKNSANEHVYGIMARFEPQKYLNA